MDEPDMSVGNESIKMGTSGQQQLQLCCIGKKTFSDDKELTIAKSQFQHGLTEEVA
jgi:hypothetical protein